ncbi:hypothetical protein BUE80_DR008553 [Diplocarpon rosae]|nr:hypothetical protein BUE80_DR008553 [Diplocarpon rosae]
MAGPEHRDSIVGVDVRLSTRSSLPPQHQAIDYDDDSDDDYDLQAMGISDGFRPQGAMGAATYRMSSGTSQHNTPRPRTPPHRPTSMTKPRALDSFALRHDGGMGTDLRRNSTAVASSFNAAPTRSSSLSTDVPHIRPESPYRGPSGPSHPYQMYPQESRLARTASIATTATVPVPDRPYNGPGGPTHPYGMYPQNTVPEAETVGEITPPVPVGFPGLNNDYQRRLGPEGEEIADIIGPDGHTEQLPPYTKYPDEAIARKTRPTVIIPVAGAGGMGLATRNPEFSSTEDLDSPSRQSTRSASSDHSNRHVNTAAAAAAATVSEKPELKKWQKVARRKLCGVVPVWVLVLVSLMFVLFGIILGTVLAILKPKDHLPKHNEYPPGKDPQSVVFTTMTSTFDAYPLSATPSGVPDLPTGTFALPITAPSAIQNSCLSNTAQSSAWACSIPSSAYAITVNSIHGATDELKNKEASLISYNDTFRDFYFYGTQPPIVDHNQVLNLVTDSQEPGRGPAWFFEVPYNKVVILPESSLSQPLNNKRGSGGKEDSRGRSMLKKNIAKPGHMPWFCYWNGTLLEAFIYVNLTSSAGSSSTSSAPAPVFASTTASAGAIPTGSASLSDSPGSSLSSASDQSGLPPAFPKVMKIEERRVPGPNAIPPYCVQHQIDESGAARPALNSTNQPIVIYLNETESAIDSQLATRGSLELDVVPAKRQETLSSCGCVWLWT